MNKVSPRVLALLATLTLVWGTNWPLFAIALREMPVATFRTFVLSTAILIVEDSAMIAWTLESFLGQMGFSDIVLASNSEEAVALAELADRMALAGGTPITRRIAAAALAERGVAQLELDLEGDDDE